MVSSLNSSTPRPASNAAVTPCPGTTHPGLPQHRDALPAQQLRRHAPAPHHRTGEGAVIDLPGAAGGAALLKKRQAAVFLLSNIQGFFCPVRKGSGHIDTAFAHHAAVPNFTWLPGNRQSAKALRAHRNQLKISFQRPHLLIPVIAAAVLAVLPQQAGGDQQLRLRHSHRYIPRLNKSWS